MQGAHGRIKSGQLYLRHLARGLRRRRVALQRRHLPLGSALVRLHSCFLGWGARGRLRQLRQQRATRRHGLRLHLPPGLQPPWRLRLPRAPADRVHPAGALTHRDMVSVLPMLDETVVVEVTGEGLRKGKRACFCEPPTCCRCRWLPYGGVQTMHLSARCCAGAQLLGALENGVSEWPKHEGRFPQARCPPAWQPASTTAPSPRQLAGRLLVSSQLPAWHCPSPPCHNRSPACGSPLTPPNPLGSAWCPAA